MFFYSWEQLLPMLMAAILLDWWLGDPTWLPHPVVLMGKWIGWLERKLRAGRGKRSKETHGFSTDRYSEGPPGLAIDSCPEDVPNSNSQNRSSLRSKGVILAGATVLLAFASAYGVVLLADQIHPWLGYAVNTWLISTTLAVKGLKQASDRVRIPLRKGDMLEARKYVGWIVGRDTEHLDEPEIVRATIETVAENTVDAFVSPIFFALLGGAPLAMLYRAANTLDSMVGYKNDKYIHLGWASARFDDVLNWLPARLTGLLLTLAAWILPKASGLRAFRAIHTFSSLHPSPNSGIPESAVAGALGIELGGTNRYFGIPSERARMGWPLRPLRETDIGYTVRLMYLVSVFWLGGLFIVWLFIR
ncbi:MAG: adenosylcobinamide-phosphate synthase CbiB [Gorillibacterium sp.]|nr:adenosylcobinamide-phosphate synthase CbiB [Gorillibacterium sp.]